jgi:hypothetical protein
MKPQDLESHDVRVQGRAAPLELQGTAWAVLDRAARPVPLQRRGAPSSGGPRGLRFPHNPSWLFADDFAFGTVVQLLRSSAPDPFPIHAVTAAGRQMPSRVRVFVDSPARLFAENGELEIR